MSTPQTPSYRQRIGYHGVLLGAFAMFASVGLMISYLGTKEDINLRLKEDLKLTLNKVIPEEIHDNDMAEDRFILNKGLDSLTSNTEFYLARSKNKIVAAAFQIIAPDGYSGPIVLMIGVDINGNILGVRVLSHAETPGLGDKIEVKKSSWILKFNNLSLKNTPEKDWHVKKDGGRFDQFSGATISPRAVVKAIHRGLEFFNRNRTEVLAQTNHRQVQP